MNGKADEKKEVWVLKMCVIGLGITSVILGILFEKQNVAYIVALTFSIAACANFPIHGALRFLSRTDHARCGAWRIYRRLWLYRIVEVLHSMPK